MLLFGFIKKKNLHSYAYDTELYLTFEVNMK